MNEKTKKVLESMVGFVKEHGHTPTIREIAKENGFASTNTVAYHLKKLEESGHIKKYGGMSRGVKFLKPIFGIPILGVIRAGKPVESEENIDGYVSGMSDIFGDREMFALRIKGDSMEDAGILDGDMVFVKKQATAGDGDIVAALVGTEATVKRYFFTKDGVKLAAENPKYQPIISKDIKVLGKIVGVVRRYK